MKLKTFEFSTGTGGKVLVRGKSRDTATNNFRRRFPNSTIRDVNYYK